MINARKIIKYSKLTLFTRFIPRIGRDPRRRGRIAQWIAHAIVVTIPAASQFILGIRQI
jgi:hypothetical protein